MSIAEKLTAVAENQQKVYDAGVAAGQMQGGYDQGYTAGQQAEYDRFWDAYQNNGAETNYYQKFSQNGWNDITFNPKYPIICKGGSTNANSVFGRLAATRIPVPVTIEGIKADSTFFYATHLKTITKLVLNGVTGFASCFTGCTKLENITIEGSIDVNFNISATAVLTNESVQSIIDHLKDLTGATTQTLTFHADVGAKLTDEQKAFITAKNWKLVY